MTELATQILNGLTLGALIALVAVGYTMVYGIIKLINFAHGEFYMFGGFVGLFALLALSGQGRPLADAPGAVQMLAALLAAGCAVALLAVLAERFAYRPLRNSGRIAALLTAVGVSLFFQNLGISVFGARQKSFPEVVDDVRYPRWAVELKELEAGQAAPRQISYRAVFRKADRQPLLDPRTGKPLYKQINLVEAGETIDAKKLAAAAKDEPEEIYAYSAVTVSRKQIVIFLALFLSAAGLFGLVMHTRVGRAMRAVSHDFQAAGLMGIPVNAIVSLTFLVGGLLAGVGGVLAGGMFIGTVDPMMGFMLGLKAFIAAVLGGIGSIPGALLGGLVLGLAEQLTQHYADGLLFTGASAYRDAIAFLILIGVLLIRPSGFFGRFEGEKV